jgi:hypothetical protein
MYNSCLKWGGTHIGTIAPSASSYSKLSNYSLINVNNNSKVLTVTCSPSGTIVILSAAAWKWNEDRSFFLMWYGTSDGWPSKLSFHCRSEEIQSGIRFFSLKLIPVAAGLYLYLRKFFSRQDSVYVYCMDAAGECSRKKCGPRTSESVLTFNPFFLLRSFNDNCTGVIIVWTTIFLKSVRP